MDQHTCKVSEETGGSFIGRKYCHTHNVVWDNGDTCPRVRLEQTITENVQLIEEVTRLNKIIRENSDKVSKLAKELLK
jgi:hypothetical protein